MGGAGGCPAGADSPRSVNLIVTIGAVSNYESVPDGLLVTPGPGSGNLYADGMIGMGTDATGGLRSIQAGTPNESMVFQVFRTDGATLGAPEGATNMMLRLGLNPASGMILSAEDKTGASLGSVATTVGSGVMLGSSSWVIDVGALLPGEIHQLTIEATDNLISLMEIDYVHACLGF
jgi:hypothetical protein